MLQMLAGRKLPLLWGRFRFASARLCYTLSPMKKLFTLLKDSLSAFLDFFSTPPRRGQCPHCGGGKCYGACQFVRKDEDGQKK